MNNHDVHLDMEAMAELRTVMADDFQLLIDTFVTDSELRIRLLAEAIASGDHEQVRRAAHSFKGSASNLGALRLTQLCKTLELSAHEGDISDADSLFASIKEEYRCVEKLMTEL